jgi:hypothetical protein
LHKGKYDKLKSPNGLFIVLPDFELTAESLTEAIKAIQPEGFRLFNRHNYNLGYAAALSKVRQKLTKIQCDICGESKTDVQYIDEHEEEPDEDKKVCFVCKDCLKKEWEAK